MKKRCGRKAFASLLAVALLLQLLPTAAMAQESDGLWSGFRRMFSSRDASAFSTLEIRKDTLNGARVVDLLSPSTTWTLATDQDYYIYGELKRPAGADSVRLRAGNPDGSFNGLTFFNPPGGVYVPGAITHDYFDALTAFDPIADPTYGSGSTKLVLQDGTMTYHIKDSVATGDTVTFAMGLVVNDAAHSGAAVLVGGLEVAVGSMSSGMFTAASSQTSDIRMTPKGTMKAMFGSTSATAALDQPGALISAYIAETTLTLPVSLLFKTLEWDLIYPAGAELTSYGFNGNFVKTEATYGTVFVGEETDAGLGLKQRHVTVSNGYKKKNTNLPVYLQFTFSGTHFQAGQQCKINYINTQITPKGTTEPIKITDVSTPVVYTLLDTSKDYTSISPMNRPEVYNHTIDSAVPTLSSLGAVYILNKSNSSPTPYEKTYEADFNVTRTAANITLITVPLGTRDDPVVTWSGVDAAGAVKTGTLATPADYANVKGNIAGSKYLQLETKSFGIVSFTSVKAEIGALRANYNSSGSVSSWAITYNASGCFGHFTTAETGIQVKNNYRFYNTDPAQRNRENGNLTATSVSTASSAHRMGFSSDSVTIKNDKSQVVDSVAAGESVTVSGYTYPYSVPTAAVKSGTKANSVVAVDPVLFLTLPQGLTYESITLRMLHRPYGSTAGQTIEILPPTVENVSYLNRTGDGVSLYKVTFPKGTVFGYYDGDGFFRLLNYTVKLRTSKSMETRRYELNSLIGISAANQVEAMPYNNNPATLNTLVADRYGLNGGKDYAGITKGAATAQPGFGLQQLAEINVYNAVSVTKINGAAVADSFHAYDPSDPNSIATLGKNSEGRFRLEIQNTSDTASSSFTAILPIPKQGLDLGNAFTEGTPGFDLAMSLPTDLQGFAAKYIAITGSYDSYDGTVVYQESDAANANAILLTRDSVPAKETYTLYFDFTMSSGTAGAAAIWRNAFQYTTSDNATQYKTGSFVASAVAASSVTGTVFEDRDRNGVQTGGEPGVPGVNVVVKDAENKIYSAVTDGAGRYTFEAVRDSELTMTFAVGETQRLRFNLPESEVTGGNAVTPAPDGLSATRTVTVSGQTQTVNAALAGFHTLRYQKNHASVAGDLPPEGEYVAGSQAAVSVKPDNLLLKGYVFREWNTQADGGGTGYQPGQTLTMTADTDLYAIWDLGTYTLRFDYRGATGGNTVTEKELAHNQPYNTGGVLPAPTREGYTFKGWCTTAAGTAAIANTTKFVQGEDTTLYALWTPKTGYVVRYSTGGGTSVPEQRVLWTDGVLPAQTPTKTGYTFGGWASGGKRVDQAATFDELAPDADTTTLTLDALWTAKGGYTVSYDTDGGSPVAQKTGVSWEDDSLLPESSPTKAGYAFGGWTLSDAAVTSADTYGGLASNDADPDITLKAVWNAVSDNTVHYETLGGTVYTDKTGVKTTDSGLLPATDPVRPGFTFIGWMHSSTTVTKDTVYSDLTTNAAVTLTANWTAKTYTIRYAEGGFADAQKSWGDSNLTGGNTPAKPGSAFDGWYYGQTKVTDATTVSRLIPQDNTTVLTLTARWVEDTYTIVYDSAGGTAFAPKTGVKHGASGLLPGTSPVRGGYTFSGWYSASTPVSAATTCGALSVEAQNGVITLTAHWTAKTGFTVRYNSAGGTAVADRTSVGWSDTGLLPAAAPTRTGYTLAGWVSGRTAVTAGTSYRSLATTDAAGSAITLVAQWTAAGNYTVYYDTGLGAPVANRTNVSWDSRNLIPLGNIAPAGYVLKGWLCGGEAVTPVMTYGELAALADPVVLTAVYEPITASGGAGTDVQGRIVEGGEHAVYKIDLTWGPMTFAYSVANVWNPDTHSYENRMQGWSGEPFNGENNKITASNHSNGDVEVDFRAVVADADAMEGVSMEVVQQNRVDGDKAQGMLLTKVPAETAAAPEISSYLWLSGTPQNSSVLGRNEYSKFGVVNVTIRSVAGVLTPRGVTP